MPGQKFAHILDARLTLHATFHQIAELRSGGGNQPDQKIDGQKQLHFIETARHGVIGKIQNRRTRKPADEPADAADHRFIRGDVRRHFFRKLFL